VGTASCSVSILVGKRESYYRGWQDTTFKKTRPPQMQESRSQKLFDGALRTTSLGEGEPFSIREKPDLTGEKGAENLEEQKKPTWPKNWQEKRNEKKKKENIGKAAR